MIRTVSTDDGFLDKLVKYVPVEGLAPLLPATALAGDHEVMLWVAFVASLLLGVVLILARAKSNNESPRRWYWLFVIIAFAAWSIGASEQFRGLLDIPDKVGAFALALTAGFLPAFDEALEKLFPKKG